MRPIEEYRPILLARAVKRGFDHDTAEDLVQQAMILAYTHLEDGHCHGWVYRILDNVIATHTRNKENRKRVLPSMSLDALEGNITVGDRSFWRAPANFIGKRDEGEAIIELMELARVNGGEDIVKAHVSTSCDAEAAAVMGLSVNAYKARLMRFREKMNKIGYKVLI